VKTNKNKYFLNVGQIGGYMKCILTSGSLLICYEPLEMQFDMRKTIGIPPTISIGNSFDPPAVTSKGSL
jgi:hypothetical protein